MEKRTDIDPQDALDAIRFYLFEPIDVGDAMAVAISRAAAPACRHRASIKVRMAADVTVEAHRSAFLVLLHALLESAIEMSAPRGEICIEISEHGLAIRSDGPCMEMRELRQLGKWFWSDEALGVSFGTGLRLAVSRSVIDHHGWSMRATNTYPGVRFFVAWKAG